MRNVLPQNAILVPPTAKRVFKGVIYDTYQWEQPLFNGKSTTFEMLKRADTIKIIAVRDDKLVIVEQEQPGRKKFYDLPGGMHDHEDESELEAAKRELVEETGLQFKTWKLLNVVQPHGKIEQFVYTFLATDFLGEQPQQLDGGEKIDVLYLDFNETKRVLGSPEGRHFPAEIRDAETLEQLLAMPAYS